MPTCKKDSPSIVLLGNFNPQILTPDWLARKDLIGGGEAEKATIQIVHPNVSVMSLGWVELTVTLDRFQATGADAAAIEPLRDLVVGVFSILSETPARAVGLNRHRHFLMDSEEGWHKVGHALAPKEPWNDIMAKPGTETITMLGRPVGFDDGPELRVSVQPSKKVQPGVYISTNEHYDVADDGVPAILKIVHDRWEEAMTASEKIGEHLLRLAS